MLTLKQIDQRIKTLRKSGYTKVHENVQEVAVSIVSHANDTGDCSRARSLVRVVPASMRPLLVKWFSEVSPINVTIGKTANDDKVRLRKDSQKSYNPFNIEKAKAHNWWENPFAVETPAKPLKTLKDYYSGMEKMLERFKKEAEDEDKVQPEDSVRVLAFRAHIRAAFMAFKEQQTLEGWVEAEQAADPAEEMARAAA